jgi:arsenate reductase
MKKIYHLKTCDTNRRILKQIKTTLDTHTMTQSHRMSFKDFTFQEIKTQPITVAQLEEMYNFTNSYEALFSKRAKRYKLLKDNNLTEKDFKQLILEEYTFLKRPVILVDDEIFVGNSKRNVEMLIKKIL